MKKRIAVLCLALLLFAMSALPVSAVDLFSFDWLNPGQWRESITSINYEAGVEMLAQANVNLYQARQANASLLTREQLAEVVSSIRGTLLDARPSDDQLRALGQTELIGDDTRDVWGRVYTEGDHEIYELVLMDRIIDDVVPQYVATLTQGKFENFELFSGDNRSAARIAEQFGTVTYTGPATEHKPAALTGITAPIGKLDPRDERGTTKSYRIFCDALTTVRLLYVRPAVGGDWRLTLTTTTVNIAETHAWYIASADAKGERLFTERLTPDGFDARAARAVAAYAAGSPVVDCLEAFTATVTLDGEPVELYTLEFAVPDTREWGMIVILSGLGIVIAAGLLAAILLGREKKA